MASFQAKIGWKRPRKRENNNYRSLPFLHDANIDWKRMKKRENKNYHYVSFQPDA